MLKRTKISCLVLSVSLSFSTMAASQSSGNSDSFSSQNYGSEVQEAQLQQRIENAELIGISRADTVQRLMELENTIMLFPNDEVALFEYAQTLYIVGNFQKSKEITTHLMAMTEPAPEVVYLAAQLEYMLGNYSEAEKLYIRLGEKYPDDYRIAADTGLMLVYYQTNEYYKTKGLLVDNADLMNPLLYMMQAFGDDKPYQLEWNGYNEVVIPFITTDPLPVIPIIVNGVQINAIIDTGAPMLVVDQALSEKLGINLVSNGLGMFAGGNTADIGFGQAESLVLGDLDIKNLPVMLGPFTGFKDSFTGYAENIHAIIGTNVLQNFIPVMDYKQGELVLYPRNEGGRARLNEILANQIMLEAIPFALAMTHYLFAQGSVNSISGLNMFVDSGLGDRDGAGISLSEEVLGLLGLEDLRLSPAVEGQGGMGGSDYKEAWYHLDSFGLGNLQMSRGTGYFATGGTLGYSNDLGFFEDALISHNYLEQYKWIIDFDTMMMLFYE